MPPGGSARAPKFLAAYYRQLEEESFAGRAWDILVRAALLLWLPFRTLQVGVADARSPKWIIRTMRHSALNFVDPLEVSLFNPDHGDAKAFMRRFELAGVMQRINPHGWRPDCVLNDKAAFAERCRRHALPCPHAHDATRPAPDGDLVIKPVEGRGGRAVRIARNEAGRFRLNGERRAHPLPRILARLTRAGGTPLIVQERLRNHPAIAPLAADALSTVRMITAVDEGGGIELVAAYLRMARHPAAVVDNVSAGGLIAPVDLRSGRLGEASTGARAKRWAKHPASGAVIEGFLLPFWRETVGLVGEAHRVAFSEYGFIGWDVAITPDGPVLVEGNSKPCILCQKTAEGGLADRRYGALIAHHLEISRT